MKLSKNFELSEFTRSETATKLGIDNTPNDEEIENLRFLCVEVLQPIRDHYNAQVSVSSGFRCDELNEAIPGSSKTSQHRAKQGSAAADFTVEGVSVEAVFEFVRKSNLPVDQVINEFGRWVHVSTYRSRGEAKVASKEGNRTVYTTISTDLKGELV